MVKCIKICFSSSNLSFLSSRGLIDETIDVTDEEDSDEGMELLLEDDSLVCKLDEDFLPSPLLQLGIKTNKRRQKQYIPFSMGHLRMVSFISLY